MTLDTLWPFFLGGVLSLLAYWAFERFFVERSLPIAHHVAIIGFPKSGKTTLITALFGEIFASRITGVDATLRGRSTIERVNDNLATLQMGKALGPTNEQDLFSYRTNITIGSFLRKRGYKVEFGDFPGESSEKLASDREEWFHHTEYFKWVSEADAFVFVIDLGHYLSDSTASKEYVAKMSKAIGAAWHSLLDYNRFRATNIKECPVVLLFTKADLFGVTAEPSQVDEVVQEIIKLGFGEELPYIEEIDRQKLEEGSRLAEKDFADLILQLKSQNPKTKVIFSSSFAVLDDKRLNLDQLLLAVLP